MDISAALDSINYLAVVVGAVAMFILGALWYSPLLFAKAWMAELGIKEDDLGKGNMAMTFLGSLVMMLIMAFAMAMFMGQIPMPVLLDGIKMGLIAGVGFVATSMAINGFYERRSFKLLLINSGYQVIGLVIIGVILAIW